MKFFQAFNSGLQNSKGDSGWGESLLSEFKKSRKFLIKNNLEQNSEFDKLLNLQERLNKDINSLATELPDDFQNLLSHEQDRMQEEIRRNKEAKKEAEELKKHMDSLAEGDEEALDRINKSLGNLQSSQALSRNSNIQASLSQAQSASSGIDMNSITSGLTGSTLKSGLGKMLGDSAGGIMSKMGAGSANPYVAVGQMIFEGVKWGVTEAVGQITDLNDQMIGLERATGGVITANKIQMTVYGTMTDSWKSLKTAAIAANISVEQITDSLKEFSNMEGGFGLVNARGMSNNKDTQNQMQSFGIESARIKKLYNTDIIPAVQGMFKNWGVSIQDGSEAMVDGVRQMRLEGLSPEIWTKNMEKLVQLSGKLTFANGAKGMKNIATMATKLGVSVDAIVDGFSQMKGFTDVFERQAEMSALGMNEYGKNLGKIYALRKQGKHDEASSLEIQSVAGDLKSKGLANFETGEISGQGIEFMDAMGMTQEQIQAMQKATQLASQKMKQLGWSLNDALKPLDKLTDSQRKQAEQIESNNKTLKEGIEQFKAGMKDQLISRLAAGLMPIVEMISSGMGIETEKTMLAKQIKESGLTTDDLIKINNKENPEGAINPDKKTNLIEKWGAKAFDAITPGFGLAEKSLGYYNNKRSTKVNDLNIDERSTVQGTLQALQGWSTEKQTEYLKSLGKSDDEIKKFTESIKKSNDVVNDQVKTQEEMLKLSYQQKKAFVAKNINEALDRAMRDLVTYGKVGKAPKVDALDKQFEQVKTAEAEAKANPTPLNVKINNSSDMLNTIKVSGVSGSW
jgi:hypothetical protein